MKGKIMNFCGGAGILIVAAALMLPGCTTTSRKPMQSDLTAKIDRFTPVVVTADTSRLSAGDRAALKKIIQAARLMDSMYIRQVWSGNEELLSQLQADSSAAGKKELQYFLMNMGPWSTIDHDSAFIEGVPPVRRRPRITRTT